MGSTGGFREGPRGHVHAPRFWNVSLRRGFYIIFLLTFTGRKFIMQFIPAGFMILQCVFRCISAFFLYVGHHVHDGPSGSNGTA